MDKLKAVTALADKLARLINTMGEKYSDQGQHFYEERYRQCVLRQLASAPKRWE